MRTHKNFLQLILYHHKVIYFESIILSGNFYIWTMGKLLYFQSKLLLSTDKRQKTIYHHVVVYLAQAPFFWQIKLCIDSFNNLTHQKRQKVWKREALLGKKKKKVGRWLDEPSFSHIKIRQNRCLLPVEPVSNSLRLPINTWGETWPASLSLFLAKCLT